MSPASHKRHHKDTWIDRIEIDTVERWKESDLSGDEWRFSYRIRLYRKGVVVNEQSVGSLQYATAKVALLAAAGFCPADEPWPLEVVGDRYGDETRCSQPGCAETENLERYFLVHEYRDCVKRSDEKHRRYRQFCPAHVRRGDCGCEDADSNYSPDGPVAATAREVAE